MSLSTEIQFQTIGWQTHCFTVLGGNGVQTSTITELSNISLQFDAATTVSNGDIEWSITGGGRVITLAAKPYGSLASAYSAADINDPFGKLLPSHLSGTVESLIINTAPTASDIYGFTNQISSSMTVAGSVVSGIADDITVLVDGVPVCQCVVETDTPGVYKIGFEPFEIYEKSSIDLTYQFKGPESLALETINLIDPATLCDCAQYCTVRDIYKHFGYHNVNTWADLGNQRSIREIATRIIDEICHATAHVDDRLRCRGYEVPFASPFPKEIVNVTRLKSGVEIHNARGYVEDDETVQPAGTKAETILRNIAAGVLRLNLSSNIRHGSYASVTS